MRIPPDVKSYHVCLGLSISILGTGLNRGLSRMTRIIAFAYLNLAFTKRLVCITDFSDFKSVSVGSSAIDCGSFWIADFGAWKMLTDGAVSTCLSESRMTRMTRISRILRVPLLVVVRLIAVLSESRITADFSDDADWERHIVRCDLDSDSFPIASNGW